jgi:hypothetical protein
MAIINKVIQILSFFVVLLRTLVSNLSFDLLFKELKVTSLSNFLNQAKAEIYDFNIDFNTPHPILGQAQEPFLPLKAGT